MNKTKIEWTDYTWNPITGCLNGCEYCYARAMAKRFKRSFNPTLHLERLDEPLKVKNPSRVFVCSVSDLFGDWIPDDWLWQVLDAAKKAPWHTYQFLTKDPGKMAHIAAFDSNMWRGFTAVDQDALVEGLFWFDACCMDGVRYVSFEPLLGPIDFNALLLGDTTVGEVAARVLDWIIIGRMTGPFANKHPVDIEWISEIKNWADEHDIPVFCKDNLGWWSRYQEFPEKANA